MTRYIVYETATAYHESGATTPQDAINAAHLAAHDEWNLTENEYWVVDTTTGETVSRDEWHYPDEEDLP